MAVRSQERGPALTIGPRGWHWITGASAVLTLGLLIALLSQTALWDRSEQGGAKPDGLTTLALILAVISFFVQIVVFVFQTKSASDDLARNQELASEASAVLTKIEATSTATQEVLFSQFDRLLDYVVGADRGTSISPTEMEEGVEDAAGTPTHDESAASSNAPVTRADFERLVQDMRSTARPTFSARDPSAPPPDPELVEYLNRYPTREAAEEAVRQLLRLSPFAVASLARMVGLERDRGRHLSITPPPEGQVKHAARELLEAGFLDYDEPGRPGRITDAGRAAARVLPIGKKGQQPEWWDEVTAPLSTPRGDA